MQKIERYDRFEDGVIACVPTILGYLGIGFAWGRGKRRWVVDS